MIPLFRVDEESRDDAEFVVDLTFYGIIILVTATMAIGALCG